MGVKPGYKKTEIGVIPEDWEVVPIGNLFDFKNGLNKAKHFFGYGTPIVNYMDVFRQPGLRAQQVRGRVDVTKAERQAYEVRKGDVFFTRTSETVEEIGIAAVMLDSVANTVFSGFVLRARPKNESLDDLFKAYCFSPRYFRQQVVATASYTTRALTNGRSLSASLLACPSIPEQKAIAEALSDVDASIAALSLLIAKRRDIRQGAMQSLLTGKTRLPGFTAAWQKKRLGDHVIFLKNGIQSRAQLTLDDPVRYVHYGDIHVSAEIFLDLRNTVMPRLPSSSATGLARLKDGDMVFVDASEDLNGIGNSLEIVGSSGIEAVSGQHTIAARFDKSVLADGYKRYLQFMPSFTMHLRRLAAGTKVYATNRKHIASAEILLPETDEQRAIALVLSDMESELSKLEASLNKTCTIKQAMMQALLTGRVRLPLTRDPIPKSNEAVHG
jgi:type I restriction enzyme, S subunit